MIGQEEILKMLDNYTPDNFPRFVIITGPKGQGKKTLSHEIAKRLGFPIVKVETKVDDIREMIETSYKQTKPIIYMIADADNMSLGAKNSLLKVIEEPPQQAYFIMTLQQIENTLETIKSRCQELVMDSYTTKELNEFIDEIAGDTISDEDRNVTKYLARNYYEVKEIIKYKPKEFYDFINKVSDNLHKVQGANSFKFEEKLDMKKDGNGYDIRLFLNSLAAAYFGKSTLALNKNTQEGYEDFLKYNKATHLICEVMPKLSINGINYQPLIDALVLDIRKGWKDDRDKN